MKEFKRIASYINQVQDYLISVNRLEEKQAVAHVSIYPTGRSSDMASVLVGERLREMLLNSDDAVWEDYSVDKKECYLIIDGVGFWDLVDKDEDEEIRALKARLAELEGESKR